MDLESQRTLLHELTVQIVASFSTDPLIAGIWLYGSLARGEGDALSDIDLVLVAEPEKVAELVGTVRARLDVIGNVALIHEAPQNAPATGSQLNVLYNTDPLPIFVDWTVWPYVEERPSDVRPLFERRPMTAGERPLRAMADDMPRGTNTPLAERLNEFRVFMAPHLMKHAARGWFDSVGEIAQYMQIPGDPPSSFEASVKVAKSILKDASPDEGARRTIERYLEVLAAAR